MTYTPPEGVTIGSFTANTLPASFSAPADAVISYKIYGTEAGVGTATSEGEPAGYKITLTVNDAPTPIYIGESKLGAEEYIDFSEQKVYKRTEQLLNPDAKNQNNGYVSDYYLLQDGTTEQSSDWSISEYINVEAQQTYTLVVDGAYNSPSASFYDSQKSYISSVKYATRRVITLATPENAAYIRISVRKDRQTQFVLGSTVPESYIPYFQPTDPPEPFPAIQTYQGESTLSSTETLGDVEFTGDWTAIMGSTQAESIDIGFTVDAEEYIAFVAVDNGPSIQVSDTITMPSSADSFTLEAVAWGRERYTDTVYNALS